MKRTWQLLNINNIKLFFVALKDIRKIGIKNFIARTISYINNANIETTQSLSAVLSHFFLTPTIPQFDNKKPIDVIIPIYNGYDYLKVLIPAVIKNTHIPYRLILFNDASPDQKVVDYLNEIKNTYNHVVLINAEKNLGFIGAVNTACQYAENHFVILNQDTEVPPHWLERLIYPIIEHDDIASTTPFTNAGTICSFPNFLKDNALFNNLDVEALDNFFQQVNARSNYIEMPTGVGFCMGMNKNVADKIGLFNQEIFGRGYAEENDWCMRAKKAGYKNVMVPNLFVYHKHGSIFSSAEKEALLKENLNSLFRLHPEYPVLVEDFIQRDPIKKIRDFLTILISTQVNEQGALLFFDHELGGGANFFLDKLVDELMLSDRKILIFSYNFKNAVYKLRYQDSDYEFEYHAENFSEIEEIFHFLKITEVRVSNLVSFPKLFDNINLLVSIKKKFNPHLIIYVHDYFMVCPSYTLLNDRNKYCGVPDSRDCEKCLANHKGEFKMFVSNAQLNIEKWRATWEKLLQVAESIICFSYASKSIVETAYNTLENNKIAVIPHQITDIKTLDFTPKKTSHFRIGVLGAINKQKGLFVLTKMAELIAKSGSQGKIIIVGETSENVENHIITVTGKYQRENLHHLIEKHNIELFFIPSIWPETFSYTAEEIMKMGLPLAVFDIGAPAERVKNYEKGLIIKKIDAGHALSEIINWRKSL